LVSLERRIVYCSRLQLVFLSATWLAGIYVNGFVPIVPGTDAGTIVLDPAVETHIALATLSAATGVFLVGLTWANGSRRATALALLATLSIVVAGGSGLAFVLGGGSDEVESLTMATAFVTSVFLTFFSTASLKTAGGPVPPAGVAVARATGRVPLGLCYLALILFYAVFVTGVYVNLFVVGPVLSLPLGRELASFVQAERSAAFVAHEALGAALLVMLALLTTSLRIAGARATSLASAVPVLLVAYSACVGLTDLVSPPVPAASPPSSGGLASTVVPMLSSAGLMAALIITMLLALKMRTGSREAEAVKVRTASSDGLVPPT